MCYNERQSINILFGGLIMESIETIANRLLENIKESMYSSYKCRRIMGDTFEEIFNSRENKLQTKQFEQRYLLETDITFKN